MLICVALQSRLGGRRVKLRFAILISRSKPLLLYFKCKQLPFLLNRNNGNFIEGSNDCEEFRSDERSKTRSSEMK